MRRLVLFGLVLLLVGGAVPAAAGSGVIVDEGGFQPRAVRVALGGQVDWKNDGTRRHSASSDGGFFDTGPIMPGSVESVVLRSAGTFAYHCRFQSKMTGVVRVPVRVFPGKNMTPTPGALIRIKVAKELRAGRVYDVQRRRDDGPWITFRSRVSGPSVRFRPHRTGRYFFRARVHLVAAGSVSGWSPSRSKFVAPPP